MSDPASRSYPDRPFACALAVCRRGERIFLARRAMGPGIGRWGFPGGMQEPGETVHACAQRELEEETGIAADPVATLQVIDRIGHDDAGKVKTHFTLIAVLLQWRSGEGKPIEDATALAWLTPEEARVRGLELFPHALELMETALGHRG